jgi:hypothetical protein
MLLFRATGIWLDLVSRLDLHLMTLSTAGTKSLRDDLLGIGVFGGDALGGCWEFCCWSGLALLCNSSAAYSLFGTVLEEITKRRYTLGFSLSSVDLLWMMETHLEVFVAWD